MPKAAALILTTIAFDVIVQSVAVGIAFFVLLQHLGLKLTPRVTVGALLLLFAVLDLLWWPAAAASSASLTLHNPDLARFFEIAPNTLISSIASVGVADC